MKTTRLSALGRTLDPRYPTNLAILLFAAAAGGAAGLVTLIGGNGFLTALSQGFIAGASVFFGWAFSREIDPDHEYSAFLSAALGFLFYWWLGTPVFLPLVLVLVLLRVITRSTGYSVTLIDSILVSGFAVLMVLLDWWILGFFTAVAFLLDGLMRPVNQRSLYFTAAIFLLSGIFVAFFMPGITPPKSLSPDIWLILLGATLLLPLLFASRNINSTCDFTADGFFPHRVQAAQIFTLLVIVVSWLVTGELSFTAPLLAAIFGTSIYYMITRSINYVR
jgi:hypothetical protein